VAVGIADDADAHVVLKGVVIACTRQK
jgi:hypothetical protein